MRCLASLWVLTEIFAEEVSSLLTDQQGRRIGVRAEVVLPADVSLQSLRMKDSKRTGQILKSTHFKFWVPGLRRTRRSAFAMIFILAQFTKDIEPPVNDTSFFARFHS
jgi:hypothetical protein